MPGRLRLVGREAELQQVAAALADPDLGGVVLSGPGGVGKTRLGEECLRIGEEAGYETARVTATAAAAQIPLGALTPLLGDVPDDTSNLLVAARTSLTHRAQGRRWILMVDDAHTLDPASATLVQGLAADRTAFVVATVRTGEVAPDAVVSLWKDEHAVRLDIEPLAASDLALLAAELVTGRLDPGAERTLCELAQGNALALRELVTGARREGVLHERDGAWSLDGRVPVTERLTEVVAHRLATLSDAERGALELVSVGEPLDLDIVTSLVAAEAAEALERERLIQLREDGGRLEVWLGHPLHGEILREQLPVLRRRRILGELVAAISTGDALDRRALLRLARWKLELGETDDVELLKSAARWAQLAQDLPSAIALARTAWENSDDEEIGVLLGQLLVATSQVEEAGRVLDEVLEVVADGRLRGLAVAFRSEAHLRAGDMAAAIRVHDEHEPSVPPPWIDELREHRAWLLLVGGEFAAGLAISEPVAQREPSTITVEAGFITVVGCYHAGRPLDALAVSARIRPMHAALWEQHVMPTDPAGHETVELIATTGAGQFRDAEPRARELYEQVLRVGPAHDLGPLAFTMGLVESGLGRLPAALDWFRRASDHWSVSGPGFNVRFAMAAVVTTLAQLADIDAARAAADSSATLADAHFAAPRGERQVAEAWLLVMEGDTGRARAVLHDTIEESMRAGGLLSAVDALHTLARCGLLDGAPAVVAALRERVQGPLLHAKLDHVEGMERNEVALVLQGAAAFEEMGANLLAAEAFFDASRMHRRAGDQRAATQAVRRGEELAALCPGAATPALRTTDEVVPLTNRERELALLAADGLSTKEIAERLFLSDRTVQNHLNRAYEKLGVSGRRELRKVLGVAQTNSR
jgi:DNA-binding CsgD family transcriptional regulator